MKPSVSLSRALKHLEKVGWTQGDLWEDGADGGPSCLIGATYIGRYGKRALKEKGEMFDTRGAAELCEAEIKYLNKAIASLGNFGDHSQRAQENPEDYVNVYETNDDEGTEKDDILHIVSAAIDLAQADGR